MRSLAEIVKANREAEKLGVGVPGAIGTKGGDQLLPKAPGESISPARLRQLGLVNY